MSYNDKKEVAEGKKLDKLDARKLAIEIVNTGIVRFSAHAKDEMKNDDLNQIDITNVLLSADARILKEPDFEKGTYRYCIETKRIAAVVAFNDSQSLTVVTAWRKTRG